MQTFVALDFETANGNRASACEIALVRFENGRPKESYSTLLLPPEELRDFRNQRIHHINLKQCENAPALPDCLQDITKFIGEDALVCHDRRFDMSVMRSTLDYFSCSQPSMSWFCTRLFAKEAFSEDEAINYYGLVDVTSYLNIKFKETHRAEPDAVACGEVAVELLERQNLSSIHELAEKLNVFPDVLGGELESSIRRSSRKQDVPISKVESIQKRLSLEELNPSRSLDGKIVVLTGTLHSMKKFEAKALLKKAGAEVRPTVSLKTDILISGEQDAPNVGKGGISGKQRKCKTLQSQGYEIEDLDEAGFLEVLAQ